MRYSSSRLGRFCTPIFLAALFTLTKLWKLPKCLSVDEWISNMCYIHIVEYYLALKKLGRSFWVVEHEEILGEWHA